MSRTRIVCMHEGKKGRSIDPTFINTLLKRLRPSWIRQWTGNKIVRLSPCGSRSELIAAMPGELRACLSLGSDTTLLVWADCDHDMVDGDALRAKFWEAARQAGIAQNHFDSVVFIFAKDRLENWIEFLATGSTDEAIEGRRVKHLREAADAAKSLADKCLTNAAGELPPSLDWSCKNWRAFCKRMRE